MRQSTGTRKSPGEKIVRDIKRATRKHYVVQGSKPDFGLKRSECQIRAHSAGC